MKERVLLKALVLSIGLVATLVGGATDRLPASDFDHSHALLGKVLDAFVKDGWVDYAGLKKNPADLKAYLDQLASVSRKEFSQWSEPEQIAFLSNLYNAATLRLIIDQADVVCARAGDDIAPVLKIPVAGRIGAQEIPLDERTAHLGDQHPP